MSETPLTFEEKLEALKRRFMDQVRGWHVELVELSAMQESWNEDAYQQIKAIAHKMVGTGGTFGFTELAETARDLEREILSGQNKAAVHQKLQALIEACGSLK